MPDSLWKSPFCVRRFLVCAMAVVLAFAFTAGDLASAADPRLERAQARRQNIESKLNVLLGRLDALEAETASVEAKLADLTAQQQAHEQHAAAASGAFALRLRTSYKLGGADPTMAMFSSGSASEAAEQARLLALLAVRSRADYESASAARVRTKVTADQVAAVKSQLEARQTELDRTREAVSDLLAAAEQDEAEVRRTLAAEQAAREKAAREKAARELAAREAAASRARAARPARASRAAPAAPAAARPSRAAAAAAAVSGGVACPVGAPRSYSDTWGAPRSGGRRHKGTDIMAPRGTPIYAYENGTITRTNNSSVGGISIYMRGASGNVYYYTHLQGYASGIRPGTAVSAGQHIAYNGDTGNARGLPHLHFEVMPGGGGNVNPYPYVRRACG